MIDDLTPIYVSSKRNHIQIWKSYKTKGFNIISSWINVEGAIDVEILGSVWWPIWLAEAATAAYLIFYCRPGEVNHTSNLLEIGSCLTHGGSILHVGVSDTMKTLDGQMADFTYHPRWYRCSDLEKAFDIAAKRIPVIDLV